MVDQSRIDAEIDLSAIRENLYSMLEGQDPKKKVIAVAKANAYGHGALRVASALEDEECLFGFAVATAAEALELRQGGIRKPILLLGYVFPEHRKGGALLCFRCRNAPVSGGEVEWLRERGFRSHPRGYSHVAHRHLSG